MNISHIEVVPSKIHFQTVLSVKWCVFLFIDYEKKSFCNVLNRTSFKKIFKIKHTHTSAFFKDLFRIQSFREKEKVFHQREKYHSKSFLEKGEIIFVFKLKSSKKKNSFSREDFSSIKMSAKIYTLFVPYRDLDSGFKILRALKRTADKDHDFNKLRQKTSTSR